MASRYHERAHENATRRRGSERTGSSSRRGFGGGSRPARPGISQRGYETSARGYEEDVGRLGGRGRFRGTEWEELQEEGEFRRGGSRPIGFAAIDPAYQRELASRGGRAAQEERSPEERRRIGRRGGRAAQGERSPEEREEIGRMGGRARWESEEAEEDLERGEYRRGGRHPMGFAAMDPTVQREIASRGGRAVPRETREEIGRRGGRARWGGYEEEEEEDRPRRRHYRD